MTPDACVPCRAPDLNDAAFWDDQTDYRAMAHGFTALYARHAWELAALPADARVLDIAAGAGALAIIAAEGGAQVLATDFSPGMVESIAALRLPRLEARVIDGEALDLPDASFDAAFSMLGIMLFANWRAGLWEMARVLRRGGIGVVGTWKHPAGAAANLLLGQLAAALFPELEAPAPPGGMGELRDPRRFTVEMEAAGFVDVTIAEAVYDFVIDREVLADPDRLFQFSPLWRNWTRGSAARSLRR